MDLHANPVECRFLKVGREDTYETARSLPVYTNHEFKVKILQTNKCLHCNDDRQWFQILRLDQDERVAYKYASHGEVSTGATPCGTSEPDCFLSYAYYSDGLCDDMIGKFIKSKSSTYTAGRRPFLCPFSGLVHILKQPNEPIQPWCTALQ